MECAICGNTVARTPIKNGAICDECLFNLPRCARKNLNNITKKDIVKLKGLCSKIGAPAMITYNENLAVCDTGILFSGCYFPFEKLKDAKLIFHPHTHVLDQVFMGTVTLEIITINKIIMEDIVKENGEGILRNANKHAFSFEPVLEKVDIMIRECVKLHKKAHEQRFYEELIEFDRNARAYDRQEAERQWEEKNRREREERERAYEEYQKAQQSSRHSNGAYENSGDSYGYSSRQENQYSHNSGYRSGDDGSSSGQKANKKSTSAPTYEEALLFFGLKSGFTQEELKKHRNMLMKLYHPDGNGSDEMSKKVNVCYSILEKYAKK